MEAMLYEILIRRVFGCARNYQNGADADIYRGMEYAWRNLDDSHSSKSSAELEYDFRSRLAMVRGYVEKALKVGLEKIKYRALKEDLTKIETMLQYVARWDQYEKDELDRIIKEADQLFQKNGLVV